MTGRNATWTSEDRCDGTLTRVRRGRVSVRAARRTVTVRAGRAYLVKARLFGARIRAAIAQRRRGAAGGGDQAREAAAPARAGA